MMWGEMQQKLRAWLEYTDNIIGLLSTYSTLNDKILIDVGASSGKIYRHWASLNPNTKIVAIDPLDEAYKKYISYDNIPNVEFIQTAITDTNTTTIEFLKADRSSRSGIKYSYPPGQAGAYKEITVPCDTLDNIFKDELENISLIKMDIEGGEYFAVRGAEQIIKNSRPIITIEPRFSVTTGVYPMIEFLNNYDYKVCDLYGYSIYNQIHNIWSDWLFYPKEKQDVVDFVNDIYITKYAPSNFKVTTVLGDHNLATIHDQIRIISSQRWQLTQI